MLAWWRRAVRVTWTAMIGMTATILLAVISPATAETSAVRSDLEEAVRARGIDPADLTYPETLNEEILSWAAERIDESAPPDRLLEELLQELSTPEGLGLQYDPAFTGTAEEVFANRRANCLAFTHLFVGLSRHYGVETYYLDFDKSERYRRERDLILVSGHVTAGFGHGDQRRVLDFGAIEGADADSARQISDLTALALYYSNRSAELLQTGDAEGAAESAFVAVQLGPEVADAWVNLGVARRRIRDVDGAREAYRKAIEVDPDHLPAYHNLTALFWMEGNRNASREIMKLLDRGDNMNPFTYLSLGDLNLASDRLDDARRYYRRAHWLDQELGEPKAALGVVALEMGRAKKARTWLRRARDVDPEGGRTLELMRRLDELEPDPDGARSESNG